VTERSGFIFIAALFALMTLSDSIVGAATLTGKADIVDGDTIRVGGIPVRLYGIDAPEAARPVSATGRSMVVANERPRRLQT
jgi:endonuclease YncB( thermonuclease family)